MTADGVAQAMVLNVAGGKACTTWQVVVETCGL